MSRLNPKQQAFADEYIIGYVYLITNSVNDKKYVGVTTRGVAERFKEHCSADSYLGKAIRKHGKNCFAAVVIDEANSKEDLFRKETQWIERLGAFGKAGYNLTHGGEGVNNRECLDRVITDEQRQFVAMVSERNKIKVDTSDSEAMMEMIILNIIQIYLSCNYKSEMISTVKLISKLSEEYLILMESYRIIDLQEAYDYYPQEKSSLGVFLKNGK